jgi:hypothetical protein
MAIFDRFTVRAVAAGAGLCGVAIALSADVAAAPLITGGYECIETSAGEAGGVAAGCAPAGAPLSDMAGIPMALPGPVAAAAPVPVAAPIPLGAPVPVGAPIPVGAPVPAGAPLPVGAPIPVGAPLVDMSGAGKEQPSGPPPAGAPVDGQPIVPGPTS